MFVTSIMQPKVLQLNLPTDQGNQPTFRMCRLRSDDPGALFSRDFLRDTSRQEGHLQGTADMDVITFHIKS